jgi:hypothetical protein
MSELDDLVARLKLDISDYEKNAKKAEKATDSLEKETKDLQETNKNTGDSFDRLMTAFTGINQAVQLVQQVFQTLQKAYDAVITSTLDYAEEVRTLSRTIGSSAEESSKLIQAADDVKVSYEDLMTGMNIAIRNGLEPTIEGMGKLADEYTKINDPIARTKFLLENFGRSGANLAPMMELGAEGIKALGAEAEATGLVLDGKAVKAARRLEIEMDRAEDAMGGLATTIGRELIPSIADLLEMYNDAVETLSGNIGGAQEFDDLRDSILANSTSFEDYSQKMDAAFGKQDTGVQETIKLFDSAQASIVLMGVSAVGSAEEIDQWTSVMASGYLAMSEEMYDASKEAAIFAQNLQTQQTIIDTYDGRVADLKKTVGELTADYQEQARTLREDLAGAYGELASAEDQWRNGVGSSIKGGLDQALEDGLITLAEYETKLGILDQYAGTQYAYEFKMEQNIPELVESLLTDPESFVTKAQAFEDYFMPLDTSIKDAEARIDELKAQLVSLERNYNVKVMIYSNAQAHMGVGADMAYEDYQGPGYASGGITHHLSPVTVGEFGPEPFIPAEDGRILSHADAMNAIGGGGDGDNSAMLSLILLELRDLPQGMKVAMQEAVALMGG